MDKNNRDFRQPTTSGKKVAIVAERETPLVQIAELMPHVSPGSTPVSGGANISPSFLDTTVEDNGNNVPLEARSFGIQNYYSMERFYSERNFRFQRLDDILIEFVDGDPQKPFILPFVIKRRIPLEEEEED